MSFVFTKQMSFVRNPANLIDPTLIMPNRSLYYKKMEGPNTQVRSVNRKNKPSARIPELNIH